MNSTVRFFAEQQDRMNIADEDIDSYVARVTSGNRARDAWSPTVLSPSGSDQSCSAPQTDESPRKKRRICNDISDTVLRMSPPNTKDSGALERTDSLEFVAASTTTRVLQHDSETSAEKRGNTIINVSPSVGSLDVSVDPARAACKQSRAGQQPGTEQGPRTSPRAEMNTTRLSVDDRGNSPSTPVDVVIAVTGSKDNDPDAYGEHTMEDVSDVSRTPIAPSRFRKVLQKNASVFGAVYSSLPELGIDNSNITTPSNSAVPLHKTSGVSKSTNPAAVKNAPPLREPATKKGASKKKQKVLVTPLEYAQIITKALADGDIRRSTIDTSLSGKTIYFYGGDYSYATEGTRKKMDILVKRGATLLPEYDPKTTTHIVTSNQSASLLLRAIGVKRLRDIPEHIPILTWSWAVSWNPRKRRLGWLHDYAAFPSRIHFETEDGYSLGTGPDKGKGKGKTEETPSESASKRERSEDSDDYSKISDFTQDKAGQSRIEFSSRATGQVSSPSLATAAGKPGPNAAKVSTRVSSEEDPLAPFYAQARAELEAERMHSESECDIDADGESRHGSTSSVMSKRGDHESSEKRKYVYACDRKGEQLSNRPCPNQDVIDKLEELRNLHASKPSADDKWRVLTYDKAIRTLRAHPKRIRSVEEAQQLRGVGEKTARKIVEIIQTGQLRRIQYEKTEDVEVVRLFQGIYGVGPKIAFQWYANGCRTLEDLKNGKYGVKLSNAQRLGIKYYDDINTRMPRGEAKQIFEMIKPLALEIDLELFVEIMGSFRRGKADCGDIDILITRPTDDGKTHAGVLKKLLTKCHECGIITEDLNLPDDWSDLENIYRGLCRRDEGSRHRRVDFLTVPYASRGAALLYYTGDDIFNRAMRFKANHMGFSLNQRGLFAGVVRNPSNRREKLCDGVNVASATEEEIFEKLGVPWQEPHERVRHL